MGGCEGTEHSRWYELRRAHSPRAPPPGFHASGYYNSGWLHQWLTYSGVGAPHLSRFRREVRLV